MHEIYIHTFIPWSAELLWGMAAKIFLSLYVNALKQNDQGHNKDILTKELSWVNTASNANVFGAPVHVVERLAGE